MSPIHPAKLEAITDKADKPRDQNLIELLEAFHKAVSRNLCPNRIWQAGSRSKDWPSNLLALLEGFGTTFSEDALQHENHSACSLDFCEFSSRNFTAVQQYHEPRPYEKGDQEEIAENHKNKEVCFPLQGLFRDGKLVEAVKSDRITAWRLDGLAILDHPKPFMAISHVWSDGTGAGTWSSKQVNECLYNYFKEVAKRFKCEGIWWDTLCIPQDRNARSKALSIMHCNYEYAKITLVHDRFLRNLPFEKPDKACFAIIMSSWFTRGWAALELAKSRKVKVVFKDSIKDLDEDILCKVERGNTIGITAAEIIRKFRDGQISTVEDLLATLGPRYTSWLKDRATIAGLLAGIPIRDSNRDTFQQDIYQRILKKLGKLSHDHLLHGSITMSKGFSWCPTNFFQLPRASTQQKLRINKDGEVVGQWTPLSVDKIDQATCVWGNSHELIEAKLRYALQNDSAKHLILVAPHEKELSVEKGLLVKVLKNSNGEKPSFKCQYVGSLHFHPALSDSNAMVDSRAIEIIIGDTEGWKELDEGEVALYVTRGPPTLEDPPTQIIPPVLTTLLIRENSPIPTGLDEGILSSQFFGSGTGLEWTKLHHAAWLGNITTVDEAFANLNHLQQQALLQKPDSLGRQALHLAAERGKKELVESLLNRGAKPDFEPDHHNLQPVLHHAAWSGSVETVELLLKRGSKIDSTDNVGNTALHIAADMGFDKVIKCLCEAQCRCELEQCKCKERVQTKGKNDLTPLHYAAISGHYDIAKLLVERDASVHVSDARFGWTPLHCAAENGQISMVQLLLDKATEVGKAPDKFQKIHSDVGWTPLHFAAMNGHMAVVKLLIERGADVNAKDIIGWTPLTFAAINGHELVVNELFDQDATIDSNIFDWTPEVTKTRKKVVQWLSKNSDSFVEMISSTKWSRLYLAAIDRWTRTTRLAIDGNMDDSTERMKGSDKLLKWASKDERTGAIGLLLQITADKKNADQLLLQAAGHGYMAVVQALIKNGANKETRNKIGQTPLICAIERGRTNIVQILVDSGAYKEATDSDGRTPLLWAAIVGNIDVVQILVEEGVNKGACDRFMKTPLVYAAEKGHIDLVRILVKNDADMEARDKAGRTPLLWAACKGYADIVQILVDNGADIEVTEKAYKAEWKSKNPRLGRTPLLWAKERGDDRIVQILTN